MTKLDPFYLIVDSADWIEKLVPIGVKLVQLRMKNASPQQIISHIRRALKICKAHDCQLIINDYWQIAMDEGCDFIHLGQEDLAEADLVAIKKSGVKLGLSTHDEQELATALAAQPNYIALGPIWPTLLKQMKWQPQGLARITRWQEKIGAIPLVAIGGITAERAPAVLNHGAKSAAVVSDILAHSAPEDQTRLWLSITRPFLPAEC